ncbi:MAG: class I SAM-dependent methyltransferase [Akkermansiaceae bacterium]
MPEILDDLHPDDPRAVRSRRDLRLINRLMRGEDWILKQLGELKSLKKVIELGAGEGLLSNKVKVLFPEVEVVALDLITKPQGLNPEVSWQQVNVLEYDAYDKDSVVIANLFIHHLSDEQLSQLGEKLAEVKAVLFAEPHRCKVALVMGRCLFPVINDVTRHDMIVSIRAGFIKSDLTKLFKGFDWEESCGLLGGIRLSALRSAQEEGRCHA